MNTLSVLLPVYNAHHHLAGSVDEILEVLPELSDRFELCILDDGSTDDTAEMAYELAARYPQVCVLRHPVRLGLSEAIQTGFDHTHGEVVFIGDEDYSLDPDDLQVLWRLRESQKRIAREDGAQNAISRPWMQKLSQWKPRSTQTRRERSYQIIRRDAFEQFRLKQSLDLVARLDNGAISGGRPIPQRPNFLVKIRRFATGE